MRNFEKRSKLTKNSDFFAHGEWTPIILSQVIGYFQIKIDRKLISLYSLQSKIGVHLLNGELTQLPTLLLNNSSSSPKGQLISKA